MEEGGRGLTKPETEASTLQWPGDRQTGRQTDGQTGGETDRQISGEKEGQTGGQTAKDDRTSVWSDESCTESERELSANEKRRGGGAYTDDTGAGTHLGNKEEEPENQLPEKAAQVFCPAVKSLHSSPSSPTDIQELWEMGSQKSPFLVPRDSSQFNQPESQFDWEASPGSTCTGTFLSLGGGAAVGGALIVLSSCVRWAWLSFQGRPEGGRVSVVSSNVLPLPDLGRIRLPAI